jgi:hypothetical protein
MRETGALMGGLPANIHDEFSGLEINYLNIRRLS